MTTFSFVFPGQGSQSLGMMDEYMAEYQVVKACFEKASAVLGYDLWELVSKGPEEKLNQTEFTQPALLVSSVAIYEVWKLVSDQKPSVMAGHSLGEYSALVCAGAIAFEDAVSLVQARGQYMQAAVPEGVGAMAAVIGLDDEGVQQLCKEASDATYQVTPANFNSIGQVVVAGHREAVEKAVAEAKGKGAKLAKLIPVSVPSHCDLMRPAAERLRERLQSITVTSPHIPVINNVDAVEETDPERIREALVKQLYSPVRWVASTQNIIAKGVDVIAECGPGKVLTGLIKRIDKSHPLVALSTSDGLVSLHETLQQQMTTEE